MAIIRNERGARRDPESREEAAPEEEIDYSWHPGEEEFVSPITAEQWCELLVDPSFAETDAAKAVRCLREYGEPATFQQLSIRYRGTMGRYRRWLGEAAQAAGERFGVPAPQQDQYGMDEWWPLLYRVRNTGKPGAGIVEMLLRPEVEEAFELIEEQERQARRAENARNLKRIEQLERARKEERERKAAALEETRRREAERAERVAAERARLAAERDQAPAPAPSDVPAYPAALEGPAPVAGRQGAAPEGGDASGPFEEAQAGAPAAGSGGDGPQPTGREGARQREDARQQDGAHEQVDARDQEGARRQAGDLPLLRAFFEKAAEARHDSMREGEGAPAPGANPAAPAPDIAAPIDYALRYAERLRGVLALMQEGCPRLSAASVARAVGDESVEALQDLLNGQRIPSFAYLDRLRDRLFVNLERLEVRDGQEEDLPAFCALDEALGAEGAVGSLVAEPPCEVAYLVDDERHVGVAVRYDDVRCGLLSRVPVSMDTDQDVMEELDAFARAAGVRRSTRRVDADAWERLLLGRAWPGAALG